MLASVCERIPARDPLDALERLVHASATEAWLGEHAAAGRAYWTRARDDVSLAGLGAVATFAPEGMDRFAAVDRAWSALLDGALIDDTTDGVAGPGPVLMGGFAFQPEGPASETWQEYPSAHLIVPRLQLAVIGGECWLTISAIVGPDGEPDVAAAELTALCDTALDATSPAHVAEAPREPYDVAIACSSRIDPSAWQAMVETAVAAIRAGKLEKVVLAREVLASVPREPDVFAMLRHLRRAHRDCFVFAYWRGERVFLGASPERLVRLDGRDVRASSLAGSAKRGATPEEDAALSAALLASAKDLAEHAAVRDALHDGLAELCDDVSAAKVPSLLTLRHVHHLHTAVRAMLRPGHSLLDVVARLHPTPAVGGTPRDAALQFIRRYERLDRGWYAAPIGWLGRRGGEFAVALRSAVLSGCQATLFAGCGIVADSDPALEFAESLLKLRPVQAALAAGLADAPAGAASMAMGAEPPR